MVVVRFPRFSSRTLDGNTHDLLIDSIYEAAVVPECWPSVLGELTRIGDGALASLFVLKDASLQSRGPFERRTVNQLDALAPHLSRATLLAALLGLQRARAMADALNSVGLPGAVLRFNGRPLAMNALFESLVPDVVSDRRERLALSSSRADRLFVEAIASIQLGGMHEVVRSIPIPASDDRPSMIVHVMPIRGAAHDVFAQAAAIIVVTPVVRSTVPAAEVLQGLFDLSPAEARVARGVAEGLTLDAIGNRVGVSRETVRTQLKAVLAKTGLTRQAELAALLAGLKLPTPE